MSDAGDARDLALEVGRRAAELLQKGWGHVGQVSHKTYATDLVTEWDLRSEALIVEELTRRAPGIAIRSEEGGGGGEGDSRWWVNPLDGTVNFAHGLPVFAVSIGLERAGVVEAGVVIAPVLGWTFAAARGEGATMNGQPIAVSRNAGLAGAMLATGFPYDRAVSPVNNFAAFEHMQRRAGAVRRLGSAALDCCFVANGWMDGYWELKVKPWDVAAGAVIVGEAGGRVSALGGGPFTATGGEILASNGLLHDEMREQLRPYL